MTIRRNVITGTGSSGIYLETGSKQNRVEGNAIIDNGFRENGAGGTPFTFAGVNLWFWGVGREGISVDGSYENTITGNVLSGNSAGGIFLYKNCGEYPDSGRYFERRDPAADNLIERNVFMSGRNGVWVGSRMGENTLPMDCTDPAYVDQPALRVVLDRAPGNTVRDNEFRDVTYGVRVEDDDTTVEGNTFTGTAPDRHAVIVGTPVPHRRAAPAGVGHGPAGQHVVDRRQREPVPLGARRGRLDRRGQHRARRAGRLVPGPAAAEAGVRDGHRRGGRQPGRQQAADAGPHGADAAGAARLPLSAVVRPSSRVSAARTASAGGRGRTNRAPDRAWPPVRTRPARRPPCGWWPGSRPRPWPTRR